MVDSDTSQSLNGKAEPQTAQTSDENLLKELGPKAYGHMRMQDAMSQMMIEKKECEFEGCNKVSSIRCDFDACCFSGGCQRDVCDDHSHSVMKRVRKNMPKALVKVSCVSCKEEYKKFERKKCAAIATFIIVFTAVCTTLSIIFDKD